MPVRKQESPVLRAVRAGEIVDDRPRARLAWKPWLRGGACFIAFFCLSAYIGWHVRDRAARDEQTVRDRRIAAMDAEIDRLRRVLNMISWKGANDAGKPDEAAGD